MKTLLSFFTLLIGASLSAQFTTNLIPNGDFEAADDSATWATDGDGSTFAFPSTGGVNNSGYGEITNTGVWGILVSPPVPGASGGGVPISSLGISAGSSYNFVYDSINVNGAGPVGGMKIEAWGSNTPLGNTGDVRPSLIGDGSTWETYTVNYALPAGTDKLVFVPLWASGQTVGFDNIGVQVAAVPEPSTWALIGGLATFIFVVTRRVRKSRA
jgi:hypothetical protein